MLLVESGLDFPLLAKAKLRFLLKFQASKKRGLCQLTYQYFANPIFGSYEVQN